MSSTSTQPVTREDSLKALWALARQGEVYRRQGQFQRAVEELDQVVEQAEDGHLRSDSGQRDLLSYVYARRGAAKLSLGFLTCNDARSQGARTDGEAREWGAIEDLMEACLLDEENGWAWAQLGEAYRVYAHDRYKWLDANTYRDCLTRSIHALEQAEEHLPEEKAWVAAHLAASYFARLWHTVDGTTNITLPDGLSLPIRPEEPEHVKAIKHDYQLAADKFETALRENPRYWWAKQFYAFLLSIDRSSGDLDAPVELLSDALFDNPSIEIHLLRGIALLWWYAAVGATDNREELLQRARRASKRVLERDHDDYVAIYVYAAATTELDDGHADEIYRSARDKLVNTLMRMLAFLFRLEASSRRLEGAAMPADLGHMLKELLSQAITQPRVDIDFAAMLQRDPFWGARTLSDAPAAQPSAAAAPPTFLSMYQDFVKSLV